MDNYNNYFISFFTPFYGSLIPTINQIELISKLIKKLTPNPKLMYHLYSNTSYMDFILIQNGIEQIICIEPDNEFTHNAILMRKDIRSSSKDLITIYNNNPLSNEFNYSNADIILLSYPPTLNTIMDKINNECKNNTLLIIESYEKPHIQLKILYTINITDKINMFIYKL